MKFIYIYVLLFSLSAFFNKKNNYVPIMAYCIYSFFYCTRTKIGTDWPIYLTYFNNINNSAYVSGRGFESGYWLLNVIFYKLGLSYWNLVTFIGIVTCVLFLVASKRLNGNYGLVFLLGLFYFFFPSYETIRSSISIVLFFYSLGELDLDNRKYLIINIIGIFFHSTSIIAIFFLIVHKYPKTKKLFLLVGIIGVGIGFTDLFSPLLKYVPLKIYRRFLFYFGVNSLKNIWDIFSFKLLEYLLLIYFFIRYGKMLENSSIIIELLEMGVVALVILGLVSNIAYRITYYTDVAVILAYSSIMDCIETRKNKVIYIVCIVLYISVRFYRVVGVK